MEAETRYARRDRAHLAYKVYENKGPDIAVLPGTFVPIDAYDDHPLIARFIARIAGLGRLVLTDRRGVGNSDPIGDDPVTAEAMGADLAAVFDHAGIARVAIVAGFDTAHGALALAAAQPERVERVVTINAFAGGPRVISGLGRFEDYESAVEEGAGAAGPDMVRLVAPSVADDPRFRAWFDNAGRRGASPATALRLAEAMFGWDITDLLPTVSCPVLVVHRVDNAFIPLSEAHALVAGLPNAELLELAGADHVSWVGDVDPLLDAIETFVTGGVSGTAQRRLATVLFTDLVSSTESAARLGDRRWRELLDVHDSTARRVVRRHNGEVIKSTGDGLLAVFDTPGAAIHAAKDLEADISALGLTMRAGIHTGEIERRGDDVGGIAVHVAARVQALAGPGEIVVSAVIPALTSGSGFQFDDMGDHELKGVPGDWRLYRADVTR